MPIERLLIANRGEIAVRIQRAAQRLGIATIAVYTDVDRDSEAVQNADAAVRIGVAGAPESYLNSARLIEAARKSGADAIHPGYGFLSENAAFAAACANAGLAFVGPSSAAIEAMADKVLAKRRVAEAGVACLDGIDAQGCAGPELERTVDELGLPLMIKARAGGGGRGMRLVTQRAQLASALASARSEAAANFGDERLFLERALQRPRHIEVQIFADLHGHLLHMGERECSIQRRHQKIVEEAPAPSVDAALRARLTDAALRVVRTIAYSGAGTVEFLLESDGSGRFYFMEMNTRLQVEHAVTEAVTGIDLVALQIQVAGGASLAQLFPGLQDGVQVSGHAIEVRVCAEDPAQDFLPATGTIRQWQAPSGVRVDHALHCGQVIGSWYDSLLAKVVAHASSRDLARRQLAAALDQMILLGVTSNRHFLQAVLRHPAFVSGDTATDFIERHLADQSLYERGMPGHWWQVAAALWASGAAETASEAREQRGWLSMASWSRPVRLRHGAIERAWLVTLEGGGRCRVAAADGTTEPIGLTVAGDRGGTGLSVAFESLRYPIHACVAGPILYLQFDGFDGQFTECSFATTLGESSRSDATTHRSPINGRVAAVAVSPGQRVTRGELLLTLEAMKMEHPVVALQDGEVAEILVQAGAQVAPGQMLARLASAV